MFVLGWMSQHVHVYILEHTSSMSVLPTRKMRVVDPILPKMEGLRAEWDLPLRPTPTITRFSTTSEGPLHLLIGIS